MRPALADQLDLQPHPEGGWFAQTGTVVLELGGAGEHPDAERRLRVGVDVAAGELAQALVPDGVWQRTVPEAADALVSCLVSPGFDFADFELAHG